MTMLFRERPSAMDQARFMAVFGGIYEHSPWVAEGVWEAGVTPDHDGVEGLHAAMRAVVENSSEDKKLELINAHPDLAGKAAVAGELTQASTSEQASAGLDRLSEAEFAQFNQLNAAYKARFGFPFIIAARTQTKASILDAFKKRLLNDRMTEVETAMENIHTIARFRLEDLAEERS